MSPSPKATVSASEITVPRGRTQREAESNSDASERGCSAAPSPQSQTSLYVRRPNDATFLFGRDGRMTRRTASIAAMHYTPMGRRVIVWSTVIGVIFTVIGLVLRPVNIDIAVGAFLLALGGFGLAGYGLFERLVLRISSRSKR